MSRSQFHSIKSLILTHAWLNLETSAILAGSTRLLEKTFVIEVGEPTSFTVFLKFNDSLQNRRIQFSIVLV